MKNNPSIYSSGDLVVRTINHDIRGALNALLNLSEIASDPFYGLQPEKIAEYQKKIHWSAQHLNHLYLFLSHHLDISKSDQIDKNHVIGDIVQILLSAIRPGSLNGSTVITSDISLSEKNIEIPACAFDSLMFNLVAALSLKADKTTALEIFAGIYEKTFTLSFCCGKKNTNEMSDSISENKMSLSPWVEISKPIVYKIKGDVIVSSTSDNSFFIKLTVPCDI